MRKVHSSVDQAIHVWAQRTNSEGLNKSGSVYWDTRDILYSYGSHFPLAIFLDTLNSNQTYVCINNTSYSVTTSSHQLSVRQATSQYERLYLPTPVMSATVANSVVLIKQRSEDYLAVEVEHALRSAAQRKKAILIEQDFRVFYSAFQNIEYLFRIFNLTISDSLKNQLQAIRSNSDSLLSTYKDKLKVERAEQLEKNRKANEAVEEKVNKFLPLWLAGEDYETLKQIGENQFHCINISNILRSHSTIYLRVKGDVIQTSHGAEFPIADATKVFPLILEVKNGYDKTLDYYTTYDHRFKLGHFKVDKLYPNGDVKAGCHFVKWEQIESVAKQLKLL